MNLKELHTNQRLFIEELIKRGATWKVIDQYDELVEISYKDKKEYILDRFSSVVPFNMVKITADKFLTKSFLKNNNILYPLGEVFTFETRVNAVEYAKNKYPLVLKPNWGSHGDNVYVNIENEDELTQIIQEFANKNTTTTAFIIEEFYPWKEYRFFITSLGEFAVVNREPASVIGDGFNNLEKLIENENNYRIKLKKQKPTSLCPIVIDKEVHRFLTKNNMSLKYTPKRGEKVFLRQESNLAKGGQAINVTHKIHSSLLEVAKNSLAAFTGMPCVGLDILCQNIESQVGVNYRVLEVNSSPGLAMHTYPSLGSPEYVAKMMVNVMFKGFFD